MYIFFSLFLICSRIIFFPISKLPTISYKYKNSLLNIIILKKTKPLKETYRGITCNIEAPFSCSEFIIPTTC